MSEDPLEGVPCVWTESQGAHEPGGEVFLGARIAGTELPERADRILAALAAAGARTVPAERHPDERLHAVHDPAMVNWLREAWRAWRGAGLDRDPGRDRVVPYLFPHPAMLPNGIVRTPSAVSARAGRWSYDTMTLIGPGTWRGARAAADVALTAAELALAEGGLAYGLCRPPGHHAARSAFGGSCYLNNAAIAAARLRDSDLGGPVAILDIDAHHGNGTQAIFYREPLVLTGSVHVDPGAGWFPHYLGFAEERGSGAGEGANRNLPLAPGDGDEEWLRAVVELCRWARDGGARALVLSLGVDAAATDPESPLEVGADAFEEAGRSIGALGLPTVAVQEGGYDLGTLGTLVTAVLTGLCSGLDA